MAIGLVIAGLTILSFARVDTSDASVVRVKPSSTRSVGAYAVGAPWRLDQLDRFSDAAARRPDIVLVFFDWAHFSDFQPRDFDPIVARGATPMLTWEPWNYTGTNVQPAYRLARIADGAFDAYIHRWAHEIAAWGKPLFLRFAHEMNGTWYPWSESVNGNRRGDYVAAWRHVHEIFVAEGASNVSWVWAPSATAADSRGLAPINSLYPGDAFVDQVGLDGYNWGSSRTWSHWEAPWAIFGPSFGALRALTSKPELIAETASTEQGGDKAQWIKDLFRWLGRHPEIGAVTWFDANKENDWRIESSPGATRAFASASSAWIAGLQSSSPSSP